MERCMPLNRPINVSAALLLSRIAPDGTISTLAGNGYCDFKGDGGPSSDAQLCAPFGVAVAPDGSIYIADSYNQRIRRIAADGTIQTVAGHGPASGFSGDGGAASKAELAFPEGLAFAPDGTLYFADQLNQRIRRITPSGQIDTIAGTGEAGFNGDGLAAKDSKLNYPCSVAVASDGSLYIGDTLNSRIRRLAADGTLTTVAGTGTFGYSGDGGPAVNAQLLSACRFAVATDGTLIIADAYRVRQVSADGTISTVAGLGTYYYSGDGGPALNAQVIAQGVAVATDGTIYVAGSNRIRKISPP